MTKNKGHSSSSQASSDHRRESVAKPTPSHSPVTTCIPYGKIDVLNATPAVNVTKTLTDRLKRSLITGVLTVSPQSLVLLSLVENTAIEDYVDYYPKVEECYDETPSDDNSDYCLETDFVPDEEAILAKSADKPLVFEGDWSPEPKPAPLPTLEVPKAGEFEIPADLADYDDGEKLLFSPSPPQEYSSISTSEATEATKSTEGSKDANQHLPSDLVHFRTAWQLVLLCLKSKKDFEGARAVSREMKAIVESVERVFWREHRLDLCSPRMRDFFSWMINAKMKIPLYAMRVSDLSINLAPNCNRIMEKISTVGGCHAETINIHCKTGQPTRIDTLLKAISVTLTLVLKSNTITGTHLTMFHCPQEAVATVIEMVSHQNPHNIHVLTLRGPNLTGPASTPLIVATTASPVTPSMASTSSYNH
ncbi:hypothetical protein Pelo_11251 [Pelomyxa schiedti]|nr:hypothetical protein Pelo_11251 [Pelomyxa schiedti]